MQDKLVGESKKNQRKESREKSLRFTLENWSKYVQLTQEDQLHFLRFS